MHQIEPKQSNFNNVQMLQRQIMFRQVKELQQRQHLTELVNTRNQNYINQDNNLFGQVLLEGFNSGVLSSASVDRSFQTSSSPSSVPKQLFHNFNTNTNFQEREEYHSPRNKRQLADYFSQQKGPTGRSQPSQTSLPSTNNRNPYDQANYIKEYAVEPENMALGENVKAASTLLGASLQDHGESVTAPSESMLELLNKDDISNDQTASIPGEASVPSFAKPCNTSHISPDFGIRLGPADPRTPQSYSFFPSLSMGTFGAASLFSHNLSGYFKNQVPTAPAYGAAFSQDTCKLTVTHSTVTVTQPSSASDVRQHVGFPTRLPTQQDAPSLKLDESSDSFPPHDSVCKYNVQEPSKYSGKSEASNLTYQSQMSSQMAPSVTNAAHLVKDSQGSSLYPPTTATFIACKQLNPVSVFPSDDICQNLAVSKKRKIIALDMVHWHKEVNSKQPMLQDISTGDLLWAETSNRRQEEVKCEAENVAELLPLTRAKRRLTCTTQLLQQLFQPAPAVILWSDARLNCDDVAYCAARSALAGACSLTCQQVTTDVLPDKLRTSNRANSCEFSKVVEGYVNRVKKLESDLSRVDRSLTFVDIKLEAGELEKFSIINRFAKFHDKAHPSTADHSSSSHKNKLQRYVSAFPMPRIVPEGIHCLSL